MKAPLNRAALNLLALERASAYLTRCPRFITKADAEEIAALGVSDAQAVLLLFCAACGLDGDDSESLALKNDYFKKTLSRLDPSVISDNPYVRAVRFPSASLGRWQLTHLSYAPYELFVRDDLLVLADGREIPQLGYFSEEIAYPAVLQDGREWMTVTPNEIATMRGAVAQAEGHVCAMGLGLGYFAFMASEKDNVNRVTVVERDKDVIALFERFLLPQFPHAQKIRIICADAFDYAQHTLAADSVDFAFVDLWHDVSDGAPLYLRMKALERFAPDTAFCYWIETSITAFLRSLDR